MRQASVAPSSVIPKSSLTKIQRDAHFETKEVKAALTTVKTAVLNAKSVTMRAIGEVLSKEQRTDYEKMLGEPFDFAKAVTPKWIEEETNTSSKTEISK